jgi:hypothetical protein
MLEEQIQSDAKEYDIFAVADLFAVLQNKDQTLQVPAGSLYPAVLLL